jgi:plastocyanin
VWFRHIFIRKEGFLPYHDKKIFNPKINSKVAPMYLNYAINVFDVGMCMLSKSSFIQPCISSNSRLLMLIIVLAIAISGVLVELPNMLHQNLVYAQATTASVSIVQGSSSPSISKPYDPSPLTVKAGTSVTWTNNDSSIHTVTSGLPEKGDVGTLFDSSLINPGMTFVHVFDKQGTFDYSCTLHPFMHGQIIVK